MRRHTAVVHLRLAVCAAFPVDARRTSKYRAPLETTSNKRDDSTLNGLDYNARAGGLAKF
jgi:hypothetical protein